jgi:hypothetical protein
MRLEQDRIADVVDICRLKARYFRFIDTKQWEQLRELLSDDLVYYADTSPVPRSTVPAVVGADEFVARVAASFASAVSVHHGSSPEIDFTSSDDATGVWSMCDWVDDRANGRSRRGHGHYFDRYRRDTGGSWRIAELRLTRIRVDEARTTNAS